MWLWTYAGNALAGFVTIEDPVLAIDGFRESGASFADLDGDGDWDLLTGDQDSPKILYNDDGSWSDVTSLVAPELDGDFDVLRGLLAADLNNDGHVDVVHADLNAIRVLYSQGPPDYPLSIAYTYETAVNYGFEGVAILDVDDDGWLDLLVPSGGQRNDVLINQRNVPTSCPEPFCPFDQSAYGMTVAVDNTDYCTVGDWDADGDTDVVLRTTQANRNGFLRSGGEWTPVEGLSMTSANTAKGGVALCDLDADGDLDLAWTDPSEPRLRLLAWDGAAFTPLQPPPPALPEAARSVACGDLDNDGDTDLVLASDDGDRILWGPTWRTTLLGGAPGIAVALADIDGDGDLDIHQSRANGPNALLFNDIDDDGDPYDINPSFLQIRVLAELSPPRGTNQSAPVYRDDIGASVRLLDEDCQPISGRQEVSGGTGRGQIGAPALHFGGIDPYRALLAEVTFRYGGAVTGIVPLQAGKTRHELLRTQIDDQRCLPVEPTGETGLPIEDTSAPDTTDDPDEVAPFRLIGGRCGCSAPQGAPWAAALAALAAASRRRRRV